MPGIYQAEIYCDDCIEDIRRRVGRDIWEDATVTVLPDGTAKEQFDDLDDLWEYLESMSEYDYDSDEYPKWCSDDEESDTPTHCGSLEHCLNPTELADGSKVGYFFGNSLTSEGEEYVKEIVREGGLVADLWQEYYDYIDYSYSHEEAANAGYVELLLSDHYGVYVPQMFAETYLMNADFEGETGWHRIVPKDVKTLLTGPDHQWYWETWDDVVQDVRYTDDNGNKWYIYCDDGAVFAARHDVDIDWEK